MPTPDIEKLRELASEMLAALTALYEACERRANEEGGDFGDDIGPAAALAEIAIAKAALLSARREGIEKAAAWHEQRAELHARDAKWMGPNREYLTGARIAGAEMSPMNGPAVSYDHEMAAAKTIRSLSSPEEG